MNPCSALAAVLRSRLQGKFVGQLAATVLWQMLAKLVQVAGVGYAAKCLGTANVGISGTVIVIASTLQLFLTLGFDTVAVRRVATDTRLLGDMAATIFTWRVIMSGIAAALWIAATLVFPMSAQEKAVWLLGAAYLILGCLDFIWVFQATHQMPTYSFLQMIATMGSSMYYLLFFTPGQRAGSDLLVMTIANAAIWLGMFWHVKRTLRIRLFRTGQLSLGKALFAEARPNWIFNLLYSVLALVNVPLIYLLLGQASSGLYRSAQMLITPLQLFLSSFTFIIYPRIVVWREQHPAIFVRRVFLLVGWLLASGSLASIACVWLHRPIYLLVFGKEFSEASSLLAWLVFAKFCAAASGVIVLAMFACRRDRLAMVCGIPPVILMVALSFALLPRYGILAGAWAVVAAELVLLASCVAAWMFVIKESLRPDEKSAG